MNKLYIAGHRGLVGSALWRVYRAAPGWELVGKTRAELDLADAAAVRGFFQSERPTHVMLAAAKVGGIHANQIYPADFLLDNLHIQNNVLECSHRFGVRKLLFFGSSCMYPKMAPQPISESAVLTGPLEETNEPYAVAKIAGLKLCQALRRQHHCRFFSVVPANLYGSHDNFSLETSHVVPALLRKFHDAKVAASPRVTLWGTGQPRREFLHVDDLADACRLLMEIDDAEELINIGWGQDLTIQELARQIAATVGYPGEICWDSSKPDGAPRKLLDCRKITAMGWRPRRSLEEGLRQTYEWFLEQSAKPRLT